MKILLILLALIATPLWGECLQDVEYIQEGDAAYCNGYLFTPEKELEIRIELKEAALDRDLSFIKDKQINLLHETNVYLDTIAAKEAEKAELWRKIAEENTLKLMKKENQDTYINYLFFGSGIVTAILTGYMVGQLE